MKLNELVRGIDTWTSNEEQCVMDKIKDLTILENFSDRDRVVIENLIRKSLVIKVPSDGITYIYPNV